jgi:Zn-dependent membrane protease YugP
MKKLIFISVLVFFLPLFLKAQDKVKSDMNNYVTMTATSLQELSTNLVDEYGLKNIQFVKLENGNYIPIKTEEVKKINQVQFSSDTILIFAIIGAVLVAVILLRAL